MLITDTNYESLEFRYCEVILLQKDFFPSCILHNDIMRLTSILSASYQDKSKNSIKKKNCLQPMKKTLHLTVPSVSFQSLGSSLELRFVDVKEEVVESRRVDEIVPDQSREERQQRRTESGVMTAERRHVVYFGPENESDWAV